LDFGDFGAGDKNILAELMRRFVSRPAFVSAHDCDVAAGVGNVAIEQELSFMFGNELTHRFSCDTAKDT